MEGISTIVEPRKLYTIFKGRMDRVAVYASGRVVSMQIKRGEWEVIERIKAHLAGQSRLGIYNHQDGNLCSFAVIIFDEVSGNPTARDSLFFTTEAAKLGLRDIKRERTKVKGENYQCWLFFEKPILVKKVRIVLNALIRKLGLTKVEIIPNEDDLTAGSVGNFAWIPYFGGIDKWITEGGEARTDLGMKQGYTVFLDEEGNPLKDPFALIHRYTEEELDNVLLYLNEYIPPDPSPNEGIVIHDSHLRKLSEKCDAYKNMQIEIRDKRMLADTGIAYLGLMMHNFCRDDYYHKILSRTADYSKDFFDKKLQTVQGRAFPTCLAFKQAGYCPAEKICFEKRPPLVERFGKFEEDKKLPEDQWREPSPAQWVFQSIKERTGAEEEAETVVIDVDIRSLEEYLDELEKEIIDKRTVLMKNRRTFCGYDTGFNLLNQVLDGLKSDTLLTLAGPTGAGKTIFCTQLIEQLCQLENIPCLYVSYGEPKSRITVKTLARMANIDYRKIGRSLLSEEELQKIKQVHARIKETFGKYLFIVEGNDSMGIKKIKEILDFSDPKCIVFDPVQSIPLTGRATPPDVIARTEQIVQQLKTLSRYKKIPIIITFSTKDKDATSEALESLVLNASDVYIHMFEKVTSGSLEQSAAAKEINFHIRKNRGGDKNIVIKYALQPLLQKFTESK